MGETIGGPAKSRATSVRARLTDVSYTTLTTLETLVIATLGTWFGLLWLCRLLARSRPGLGLTRPLVVGYGLRLAAIALVSAIGIGTELRGGDEIGYIAQAHHMASSAWFSAAWHLEFSLAGTNNLHVIVFAAQIKVLHFGWGALRITQVGIALTGSLLIVAAVYDLAGLRAARLTAWFVMVEPTNVFYSGTLLKEPLLDLAIGLVIFGGARVWRRLDATGLTVVAVGCAIGVFDRGYVGFFLIAGVVLMLLHASGRHARGRARAIPLALAVLVGVVLVSPAALKAASQEQGQLVSSQNANTLVDQAPSVAGDVGKANGNNLALEPVNFSSRTEIIEHLPERVRDLLLKPYPWQLGDWSQRLGAIGGLIVLALLLMLARYAWRARGAILKLTPPFLYPTMTVMIAFSLSDGNAGTGFRYRADLIAPSIGLLAILWAVSRARSPADNRRMRHGRRLPYSQRPVLAWPERAPGVAASLTDA